MSSPAPIEEKNTAVTGLEAGAAALSLDGSAATETPVAETPVVEASSETKTASPAAPEAEAAAAAAADGETTQVPPHRSHDPNNNLKRSDPFQFGSRYLNEGDDVFEFNAWDHVETDETYREYTEQQIEKQRQSPVSDFDKSELPFVLLHASTHR